MRKFIILLTCCCTIGSAFTALVRPLRMFKIKTRKQPAFMRHVVGSYIEETERRHPAWRKLLGRKPPSTPLARDESIRILDLMQATLEQQSGMSNEARSRLHRSIKNVNDALRHGGDDAALATVAAVGLGLLQRDVRDKRIEINPSLRHQLLGISMNSGKRGN